MAIKNVDEIMQRLKAKFGEDDSEETLELVSDISDTINAGNGDEWKKKYEENDAAWKKKYRDRFYARVEEEDVEDKTPETKKKTFNDLFKDGE